MRTKIKNIFLALFAILMMVWLFPGTALASESGETSNVSWTVEDNVIKVTLKENADVTYIDKADVAALPDEYDKVVFEPGFTGVGVEAFKQSTFKEVNLPDTITYIDEGAFSYCAALKDISLPKSVTTIGIKAFQICTSLESVVIQGEDVTEIPQEAFKGCQSLNSIILPDSLTAIGREAFKTCTALTTVSLPDDLTTIGYGAFGNCSGLTKLDIPGSVTTIDTYAFANCIGLTSLYIHPTVTTLNKSVFKGCKGLEELTLPFKFKATLSDYEIPEGTHITYIDCPHENIVKTTTEEYLKSAATCSSPAIYYYECTDCESKCDYTYTYGEALPHTKTKDILDKYLKAAATCTEPAVYYYACEVCGEKLDETFVDGMALGHSKAENTDEKYLKTAASCTEPAVYYYSCEVCGEKLDETFAGGTELGHSKVKNTDEKYLKSAASCTEPAAYYYTCEVCGEKLDETFTEGTALGHNKVKRTEAKYLKSAASCTEPAVYYYVCEVCGQKLTETYTEGTALGHKKIEKCTPATVKKDGKIDTVCERCGALFDTKVVNRAFVQVSATVKYTGKSLTPVKIVDKNGKAIAKKYYTITYKNNKKVGKATATIKFTGAYTGKYTVTFQIVKKADIPSAPSGVKLKAAKGKVTVSWKKITRKVNGFEIEYTTDKKFIQGVKTVYAAKASATSKTISRLKKGTYYVRIRSYRKVGNKKVYSAWTTVKNAAKVK